jgi:hypothetical protein
LSIKWNKDWTKKKKSPKTIVEKSRFTTSEKQHISINTRIFFLFEKKYSSEKVIKYWEYANIQNLVLFISYILIKGNLLMKK